MLLSVVALAIMSLVWVWRRDRSECRRRRGVLFSDCLDLFDSYRVEQDGVGFAVLSGVYRGRDIVLEPIIDHVAFRKIPSLWLRVTLLAPVPYRGVFDLLARPRGSEFYSPSADLAFELPNPEGWPQDAVIRVDDPQLVPSTDLIARHVRLFADPRTKELLITSRGVRLVYQAAQAERAHYLVLRQLEFEEMRLSATLVASLLDAALDIHASIASPSRLAAAR